MIYIKVNNKWYSTEYEKYNQLKMYESGQLTVAYDSDTDEVVASQVWHYEKGYQENPASYEQVKLELFLQGDTFTKWDMDKHRFKDNHKLTLDNMDRL